MHSVTKADVGRFFNVPLKTVDDWIRRGCPYVKAGSLRDKWVFDLLQVCKWRYGPKHVQDSANVNPEQMNPQDRKAWYYSEYIRLKLQDRDAQLIPIAEMRSVTQASVKLIEAALERMPISMAATGIPDDVIAAVECELQQSRFVLRAGLAEFLEA